MKNRNRELIKNTIILMIGQFVPKIMAIIVLPILTGSLSKEDYGLYDLSLTVASFCIPLISIQIQQAVFRYLIEQESNKYYIITSSLFFMLLMFMLSSIVVIYIWYFYISNIMLAILFVVSYFVEAILSWCGQVTRGLGNNLSYSLSYAIYSIIFVILLCIKLVLTEELSLEYIVIAMIVSYTAGILFLLKKSNICKYIHVFNINLHILKKLLLFSGPMVISSISLWIVNLSDRFCISLFLGLEANAIYAVSNKIPNLINSFFGVFNLAWTENTSKLTDKEKKGGYYSNFFDNFYVLLVGIMLCLITLSPLLFKILINNKYSHAYALMSWLYIGVFFSILVSYFGSIYVGEKKTREVGISSIIGAFLNVTINIFFMKRFGVMVAALSTIISYLIILLYRVFDIKNFVNIKYNIKKVVVGLLLIIILVIINNEFSWMSSLFSVLITVAYNLIYNRYILFNLINRILNKKVQ